MDSFNQFRTLYAFPGTQAMTGSFWRDALSLQKPFPVVESRETLVFYPPAAGCDEEYIYMNKVTVNKQQNVEPQDKGTG